MLNIKFLGTGGGMPMTFRALSSIMLSYKGRKILLDCGEGTQVGMRKYHTGFKNIDIICISHIHGDHIFGLPGLLATMGNSDRKEKLTILGPKGIRVAIEGLLLTLNKLPFDYEIIENPHEIGISTSAGNLILSDNKPEIVLNTCDLDHRIPCLGYSFVINRQAEFMLEKARALNIPVEYWGKLQKGNIVEYNNEFYYPEMVLGESRKGLKLSFVTDTRPTENIVEFIDNSDLFICEGTYCENSDQDKAKKNKHMTFNESATMALKANVKSLILTHFSPSVKKPKQFLNNATDVFKYSSCAYDGLELDLKFD